MLAMFQDPEVNATLGDAATARRQLQQAFALTRGSYGASHPHTLRSELSLARFDARTGNAGALQRLERLGSLAENEIEVRKVAWLARAYFSERTCHGPQRKRALDMLAALDLALRQALPEGGAVVREVDAIRDGCVQPPAP